MDGKTVAITGCTTGTGFALAKFVAEKGGAVVLLNRESSRSSLATSALSALAPGKVTSIACDLTSFASVREAAATLRETLASTGLDVLCCNAGVMALEDATTTDGFDIQFQVRKRSALGTHLSSSDHQLSRLPS